MGAKEREVQKMKLLIIVLNKVECLDKILTKFGKNNLPGATILDSKGMAQSLEGHDELRFLGSLRLLMNPAHKENKTIFMVLPEEKIPLVSKIVNEVTGGLTNPDTGILFTVPVDHVEGVEHHI